jgi:hypothetical protein
MGISWLGENTQNKKAIISIGTEFIAPPATISLFVPNKEKFFAQAPEYRSWVPGIDPFIDASIKQTMEYALDFKLKLTGFPDGVKLKETGVHFEWTPQLDRSFGARLGPEVGFEYSGPSATLLSGQFGVKYLAPFGAGLNSQFEISAGIKTESNVNAGQISLTTGYASVKISMQDAFGVAKPSLTYP